MFWLKHVGGFADYNIIKIRICICTFWVISHKKSLVHGHESFKVVTSMLTYVVSNACSA